MESVAGWRTWTRDALAELIGEGSVSYLDEQTRSRPVPPKLMGLGTPDPSPFASWTDFVARVHRGDRTQVARAWHLTLDHPAEPLTVRFRQRRAFAWWECEFIHLNLLHDPEVHSIVRVWHDIGPSAEPDDDQLRSDDRDDRDDAGSSPVWLLRHLDELGVVKRAEGFALDVFGVDCHELVGSNALDDIHPDDRDVVIDAWFEMLAEPGGTRIATARVRNRTGIYRWYETMVTNQLHDPEIRAVVSMGYDIEDRRRKESAVRASERQFRALAEEMPVAVFRADRFGHVTYANDLFRATIGDIDSLDRLGNSLEGWWQQVLGGQSSVEHLFELDEMTLRIRGRAQRAEVDPESSRLGPVESVIGSVEDVTAAVVHERYLHELAHSDPLTGVANRRVLEQVLDQALARDERVLVIVTDLDGFKALNDRSGHHVGDLVLIEVARRLGTAVRPDDLVSRFGGDEFVVVCRGVSDDAEADLVGRVRDAVSRPLDAVDGLVVEVSVGSARAIAGDRPADVLRRADEAMYADKRRGAPRHST